MAGGSGRASEARLPEISVVVPVFEQWDLLAELLAALSRQSLAADRFEILIVDNAPGARELPLRLPPNGRLLHCHTPGSYAARRVGVDQAKGAWLAFTDADCQPDADWLHGLIAAIEASPDDDTIVAGDVRMRLEPGKATPWAIYDFVKGIPQEAYVKRGYAATANLCVSRRVYDRIGGFDAARFSGGDADFCRRAVAAGARLVFAPSAFVWHPVRTRWQQIATKARRIKGGQQHGAPPSARGDQRLGPRAEQIGASRLKRLYWLSPIALLRRVAGLLARSHAPLRYRLIASGVCILVWGVEVAEAWRLARGGAPERR